MKSTFWNSEKLLSLSAILISICTLLVFTYQTNLIRKQQHMSVYPYLNLSNAYSNSDHYTFILQNMGVGPAIIKSITVISPDKEAYTDITDYVYAQISELDSMNFSSSSLSVGRMISEKELIEIIKITDGKISSSQRMREILNHKDLEIEIVYESIYGDRWLLSNQSNVPEKQ